MNLEQTIQKRFTDIITNRVNVSQPSEAHHVYANLIFYRLKEIFEKSFPRFIKLIESDTFDALIYEFIKNGAITPILWKVNEEFKEFVLANSSFDIPYLKNLLDFEFLELYMHMQKYPNTRTTQFALEKNYKLSDFCKIIEFEYPVHHPDFDTNPSSLQKAPYFVLVYYNEESLNIMCEEISPFVKELLEMLSGVKSIQKYLQDMAKTYEVSFEEILADIEPVLEVYVSKNILQFVIK